MWCDPIALNEASPPGTAGFYRPHSAARNVEYIGQAIRLADRMKTHRRGADRAATAKYQRLAALGPLEVSWTEADLTRRARLEVEDDLLAKAVVFMRRPPAGQYLDRDRLD